MVHARDQTLWIHTQTHTTLQDEQKMGKEGRMRGIKQTKKENLPGNLELSLAAEFSKLIQISV